MLMIFHGRSMRRFQASQQKGNHPAGAVFRLVG
jgi:hypothetical protein